jgi:RNA polymerase sigma factor (sigma-70 family)
MKKELPSRGTLSQVSTQASMMSTRVKLVEQIAEALDQMPARVRRVFILSHYQGLSVQRIAATLGIQESEAKSLLSCGNTFLSRTVSVPS